MWQGTKMDVLVEHGGDDEVERSSDRRANSPDRDRVVQEELGWVRLGEAVPRTN